MPQPYNPRATRPCKARRMAKARDKARQRRDAMHQPFQGAGRKAEPYVRTRMETDDAHP